MKRRHSYQIYKDTKQYLETVISRKMIIIIDIKGKAVSHSDGHLLIFYRKRDANYYIIRNKKTDIWRIKKVNLGVTTV